MQHEAGSNSSSAPATSLLVLTNLLFFSAVFISSGGGLQIDIDTLVRFGANDRVVFEQPWRLISCAFLHVDRLALLANMWWLIWTGPLVERRIGPWAFLFFYLSCAAGASLTSAIWHLDAVSVGASGAVWGVWGLVGVLAAFDVQSRADKRLRHVLTLVAIAVVADLATSPLRPHVDTAAHLGGLLSGIALGTTATLLARPIQAIRVRRTRQATLQAA